MLKNYLKITLRNLRRHKGYTFINVAGLAVGLACCLLIALYVQRELSYDRFHEKSDRIYRVAMQWAQPGTTAHIAWAPGPLAPVLNDQFPNVEEAARLADDGERTLVQHGTEGFYEDGFVYADPAFFEMFDFPVQRGDPQTGLRRPFTLFLSASMAKKYFPGQNPIGQTLTVDSAHDYEVTGVFEDVPRPSHVQFDFVASHASRYATGTPRNDWNRGGAYTYVLLKEGSDPDDLEAKLNDYARTHATSMDASTPWDTPDNRFSLVPLTDIHLFAQLESEQTPQGDIRYVYLFSAIGLLILLIACINYMNMATARSIERAREVGMRKVVGASRGLLVRQFLGESVLLSFIALALALVGVKGLLPVFNHFAQGVLSADWTAGPMPLVLVGITLFVGLVSGSYPAVFLSRLQPARVLKGHAGGRSAGALRKGLIVFQLCITIALIACAAVIQQQMHFVQQHRLGFEREQIVMMSTRGLSEEQYSAFKSELLKRAAVRSVTTTSFRAGEPQAIMFFPANHVEGLEGDTTVEVDAFDIGRDFVRTFGLTMTAGRALSASPGDMKNAVLVNESAVKRFGWDEPLGKRVRAYGEPRTVVGVVKDFHARSLKEPVKPSMLVPTASASKYVAVKVAAGDLSGTLGFLGDIWHRFVTSRPLAYSFLDDDFDALYRTEQRLGTLLAAFALLAVFIACLGLFGLAALTAERRTKEIGIRKVLGASVASIVALLSKDFAKLVGLAFVLAAPLAYLAAQHWLEDFAYRVELSPWLFLAVGAAALLIALLTVSVQAVKAALANPTEALRAE